MESIDHIEERYKPLSKVMDEKMRRLWAADEAKRIGWGGISMVSTATGLSRSTITRAIAELDDLKKRKKPQNESIRRRGGGRKQLIKDDPALLRDLVKLIEPASRGDPQSPLQWTCKSTKKLADELDNLGHHVSDRTVAQLLYQLHYSLQSNQKSRELSSHPDRNAQFEYINDEIRLFQEKKQPILSVDAKKRESIGDFKNAGQEWHPKGKPEQVRSHDFEDKALGHGIPYGVYNFIKNNGWVSVGTDHNTAEFAGETIRRWWQKMGLHEYPDAKELLIIADGGGSNSSRCRLWKISLQILANKTNLKIHMSHLPPGTSKWNKIEHRMFSFITQNWRGRPLISHEVMVNLIGNTKTKKGLRINVELDDNTYETGINISDDELATLNIMRSDFHGEWNYVISSTLQV